MAKKELLSKLNLKDYNNELELILEKKDFSVQVKNLLLSMFYKIETNYKDYTFVKQDIVSKDVFMETLMYIIKTKCNVIELVKPKEEDDRKFWINKEEGSIKCYQNESTLLHAILNLDDKYFLILDEYNLMKRAVQKILADGYELDIKEMITNFDGWAWNNNIDSNDDIQSYIVYQNLRILMGNTFLYEWKRDRRKRDYLSDINKYSNEYLKEFYRFCLLKALQNKEEKDYIKKELATIKDELGKMQNKNSFLKEIYEEKRKVSEKIKLLDKILNDTDLMKEEFIERNANLPSEQKIFSISNLEETIQKERNDCMENIHEYNKMMDPKNYITRAKKLEEKIELINSVKNNKITQKDIEDALLKLQKSFMQALKQKVSNSVTKKEIIELVYAYRYYLFLPIKKEGKTVLLKEVPELKIDLENIANMIITRACKLGALIIVNQDIKYNYKIMQKIIDTKIIHLEDIFAVFSKKEENIYIEVYDSEILDRTEVVTKENEKDFMIKFNKKIKIFV